MFFIPQEKTIFNGNFPDLQCTDSAFPAELFFVLRKIPKLIIHKDVIENFNLVVEF